MVTVMMVVMCVMVVMMTDDCVGGGDCDDVGDDDCVGGSDYHIGGGNDYDGDTHMNNKMKQKVKKGIENLILTLSTKKNPRTNILSKDRLLTSIK